MEVSSFVKCILDQNICLLFGGVRCIKVSLKGVSLYIYLYEPSHVLLMERTVMMQQLEPVLADLAGHAGLVRLLDLASFPFSLSSLQHHLGAGWNLHFQVSSTLPVSVSPEEINKFINCRPFNVISALMINGDFAITFLFDTVLSQSISKLTMQICSAN